MRCCRIATLPKIMNVSSMISLSLHGFNIIAVLLWQQQYDEKNIRRRVYDALNVLMAVGIILKDKKDIQWKGFPSASLDDVADLKVTWALLVLLRSIQLLFL